jgi:hypothetical protein
LADAGFDESDGEGERQTVTVVSEIRGGMAKTGGQFRSAAHRLNNRMRYIWIAGLALGLVAGITVLSEIPLFVKLLVGLATVVIGVAGPFGSVLLAGLLLGAGLVTFVILLVSSQPEAVSSALGVATLLIASGAAFSLREMFRARAGSARPPMVGPNGDE